ncbi:tetratricopeptide repeat protein [Nonomuraea sp. NN258]|uniref:tetratricopeptide repeat protein n=1 Tax=Nonomuraea antri TaxID=2730852 RepID=UPI0015693855|nr:tetratricopeptide repeat protein [Nonomuraea antri]NRQ32247.1 tetratricopeptide repeat protein [Nonomuraea antri]
MSTSPTSLDMALALLREGRLVDAEQVMMRELQTVEEKYGSGSPEWASVQCDLGNVLLNADQPARAVECYRAACSGPAPQDPEARKDRLTYQMNLGMVLASIGRLDEAESELRANVGERLAFYGREHAGYAFGLEPLAEVLLRRGDLRAARESVEEAIQNFWHNGHERIAAALALRARIVTAAGGGEPAFVALEQLPDEIVEGVALAVLSRAGEHPETDGAVLSLLAEAMEARLGPDHQTTLNALSMLANVGGNGDGADRVAAIRKVLASYRRQGRAEEALMAGLGLAMAQCDTGDLDGALRTYAEALDWARSLGRADLVAQVLRNWGLALSEADRPAEAEQRLREALSDAERSGDQELLGRVRIALGLFLQHQNRLAEARQVVEAGLGALDAAHPDALVGRSHLGAIMEGRSCGCGDLPAVVAEAFKEFVLSRLPQDLLADLGVDIEDGDFAVSVELRREPTEDELDQLNRVIQSATAEFRRRLTTR